MEKATFGAGCFWGVEEAFRNLPGVAGTAVGYMGGTLASPTYEDVCTGRTGHAEIVQVEFDPEQVSYEELLETLWKTHDPTQRDRQGLDVGRQYRSAVFFHTPEQEAAAIASRDRRQALLRKPITTEITPASEFWRAEEYHQCYFDKHRKASFAFWR